MAIRGPPRTQPEHKASKRGMARDSRSVGFAGSGGVASCGGLRWGSGGGAAGSLLGPCRGFVGPAVKTGEFCWSSNEDKGGMQDCELVICKTPLRVRWLGSEKPPQNSLVLTRRSVGRWRAARCDGGEVRRPAGGRRRPAGSRWRGVAASERQGRATKRDNQRTAANGEWAPMAIRAQKPASSALGPLPRHAAKASALRRAKGYNAAKTEASFTVRPAPPRRKSATHDVEHPARDRCAHHRIHHIGVLPKKPRRPIP